MKTLLPWLRNTGLGLLLLVLLGGQAGAAGIGFRNLVKIPIIVQGASVENNMLRRGPPLLIIPGKVAWDLNLKPGVRIITVYDGTQPTRILFQGPVPFQGSNLFFAVNPHPRIPFRVWLVQFPVPP